MANKKDDTLNDLTEFMNSDVFQKQKKLLEEKKKTVKHGANVVHINYYENIIEDSDLKEYSESLEQASLELSSYNKTGVIYASLEDYTNLMNIALGSELTKNIVYGVAGNIVWDAIKTITKKVFVKIKNKKLTHFSGANKTKKTLTFGINFSLDKNTGFNFRLDSKLTSTNIDEALEQTKEIIKEQKPNEVYTMPSFLYYDKKKKGWVAVDVMEEIRKKTVKKKPTAIKKKKITKIKKEGKKK